MFRHWLRQLFPHRFRSGRRSARRAFYRPLLDILEGRLAPATCVFNYSMSSAWEDAANWTGCNGMLPGPNDVAQIGNPGHDATVTLSSSQTISRLMATGDTHFSTSLNVNGNSANLTANSWQVSTNFTLNLTSGTLTVTPTGSYNFTGGSAFHYAQGHIVVSPTGTLPAINFTNSALSIDPGATDAASFVVQPGTSSFNGILAARQTINVGAPGGSARLNVAGGASNAGTIQLNIINNNTSATFAVTGSGAFTNAPGGVIRSHLSSGYGSWGITGNLTNQGRIIGESNAPLPFSSGVYEEAGGSLEGNAFLQDVSFRVTNAPPTGQPLLALRGTCTLLGDNLAGTFLDVQAGNAARLNVAAGASNEGTIQLDIISNNTAATLTVTGGGAFVNAPPGGDTPGGVIRSHLSSGYGSWGITGNLTNQGRIIGESNAPLPFSSGVYEEAGGSLEGNAWLQDVSFRVSAASRSGGIALRGTCTLIGDNPAGSFLDVQAGNAARLNVAAGASNAGTIQLNIISNNTSTTLAATGAGSFTNASGGVIRSHLSSGYGSFTVAGNLVNDGTVQDDGVTLPFQNCSFLNDATGVITGRGTISFPGTSTLQNDGTVAVAGGATLAITGALLNFQNQTLLGGTYQVAGTFQFDNARIATLAATVELSGAGAIQTTASGHANALVSILNTITADGSLTVDTNSSFTTGTLTNNGSVAVGLNSTFTLTGNYSQDANASLTADRGSFIVRGTFTNFDPGSLTLTGGTYHLISDTVNAGKLQFPGADIQTNAATIILDGPTPPTAPYSIVDPTGADALAQLSSNQGSLTVTGGRSLSLTNVPLDNPGTLVADTGSAVQIGELSNEGNVAVNAGGSLQITTLDNFANSTLNGGTWTVAGTLQFTGADIQTNAANLTLDASTGRIIDENNNSGLRNFQNNSGSFTLLGDDPANPATLTLTGVQFTDNGMMTVGPAAILRINGTSTNSSYTENGSVMIQDTGTLRVDTTLTNYDPTTNTLSGGVFWIAGTLKLNHPNIQTNAATLILYGSDWMVVDLLDNNVGLVNLAMNNTAGVLQIVDGIFDDMSSFTNGGQVSVDASKVGFYGNYTQLSGASTTLLNGSLIDLIIDPTTYTFFNNAGATLSGTGSILGNVVNDGQISLGDAATTAVLTIEGNFTQTANGVLVVKLGGSTPDAGEFDQLHVTGDATLDGTLQVVTLDDFSTDVGYMYQVVTCDGAMTVMDTFTLMAPDLGGLRLDLAPPDGQNLTLITDIN